MKKKKVRFTFLLYTHNFKEKTEINEE